MLAEASSRHRGQLFTLVNGDLSLLFPSADGGFELAATLASLFASDAPDAGLLLSRWSLPDRLEEFAAFLDALPTIAAAPDHTDQVSDLAAVTKLSNAVDARRIRDLLERQTGALVTLGGSTRVVPIYREVRFALPVLKARAAASGYPTSDQFLFRHLIAKLDSAMLAATTADLDYDRPMLSGVPGGNIVLHVNMSIEAVLSPAFAALADAAAHMQARIAVEIGLLETFADTDAFVQARSRVKEAGFALVLDDVTHHALLVTRPAELGCDWLKLDWSRQIAQSGASLDRALQDFGPAKVILQNADTEEAVRWGIARGIRRFQGRHIDAILAASRLAVCPAAGKCTLRKCIEREGATTASGRIGCENLPLLDRSTPEPEPTAS